MATRARVLAVAVLATVVVAAAAASATADVAPAPGAMVAVPPPPPPPVMAPSEAAERFARSVVLESVGAEDGADEPAAAAAAAAPGASGGDGELLRWAISHSDPAALREAAKQARASSTASLEERQRRVAELREVVETSVVSEADMIKQAVAVVQGHLERRRGAGGGGGGIKAASGEEDSRSAALSALGSLADLAQSIDNANDLRPLGALAPLAALLEPPSSAGGNGDSALRAAAGRCVGVAASNNAKFQADFLAARPEAVAWLLQGLEGGATGDKLRLPLLFAASTFARSASAGSRDAFFAAGGVNTIGKLLRDGADGPALALNAAVLLGDLADLAAAGDDGGALVAAVGGAAAGEETWRALAEGVLETVGGRPLPAPAAMDKALSAVRALSGLESGRRALAAAGGAEALRVAGDAVVASGGGAREYREYLSELAREIAEGLSSADGGGGRAEL